MPHLDPRPEAQLHALPRQGEGARDDRLRGDDRRGRREDDEGVERPVRREAEEEVVHPLGVGEEEGALPRVVEDQRRVDEPEPAAAYGRSPEVAHVGVEHLGAGDRQDDRAEYAEDARARVRGEADGLEGIEGRYDPRLGHDRRDAKDAHDREPYGYHWAEDTPDLGRAPRLEREQGDEDEQGEGQDIGREIRRDQLESLDGREHRDGRRDHPIAVDERGAEDPQAGDEGRALRASLGELPGDEADEGENAALALVVRAQDYDEVLDADHEGQDPQEEGDHADHVVALDRDAVRRVEALSEGIYGRGADVAEDYAYGAYREG